MYKKFMRTKKVLLPTLTALLIAGQLTACSPSTKQETASLIKEEPAITLEIATPKSIEQGTSTSLQWIEVGSLVSNPELRNNFDKLLGVTGETGKKVGSFYGEKGNQNITLREALQNHNTNSLLKFIFTKDKSNLAKAVENTYLDMEKENEAVKISMGINGYFNLLPDNEPGYANPHKTLTRAEFMSALMRSVTPVSTLIKKSDTFSSLVGNTEYDVYAERVEKEAYLNTKDKSLNSTNYNTGAMSRAEAIYLIMNHFFTDELDMGSKLAEATTFDDVKNAGNIKETKNFTGEQVRLKELAYVLENPQEGTTHGLYKALALAYEKGFITTKVTRWNEGITKAEGIDLIIKALAEVNQAGIVKNGLEVVEEVTEETEDTSIEDSMTGENVNLGELAGKPFSEEGFNNNVVDKVEIVEELNQTMITLNPAFLREKDTTNSEIVSDIEDGVTVEVTGKTSNGWFRVERIGESEDGTLGYIHGSLLKLVKVKDKQSVDKKENTNKKDKREVVEKPEQKEEKQVIEKKEETKVEEKQVTKKEVNEPKKKETKVNTRIEEKKEGTKKEIKDTKKKTEKTEKKTEKTEKKTVKTEQKKNEKVDMTGWEPNEIEAGRRMTPEERKKHEEAKRQGFEGGYNLVDWGDLDPKGKVFEEDDYAE